MAKLTKEESKKAKFDLESRLLVAIEQTPKGVTDEEILESIQRVLIILNIA